MSREEQLISLLDEINELFHTGNKTGEIFSEVSRIVSTYYQVPIVAIELYDPENQEMVYMGCSEGTTVSKENVRSPVKRTLSGNVVLTGDHFVARDVSRQFDFLSPLFRKFDIATLVCCPLQSKEGILGTLSVADTRDRDDLLHAAGALKALAGYLGQGLLRGQSGGRDSVSANGYRAIVEDMPGMVCSFLPDGEIVFVNQQYCTYFDKSYEDLVGSNFLDVIPASERAYVQANITSLGFDSPVHSHEHKVQAPHGGIRWQKWTNRAIFNGRGEIIHYHSLGEDITDRKIAELELLDNRAKLDAALNSMQDGLFIADSSGKLIDFNCAWASFSRFESKEECLRKLEEYPDLFEVTFPDGEVAPLEAWALPRALRGETECNVEFIIQRKDTGERWMGSYSFGPVLDTQGIIMGAVVVARDITEEKQREQERRQVEQELRQAQKMESIGHLAGGVAHEFNNILSIIIGYNDFLLDDLPEESSSLRYSKEICDACLRARDVVRQLLTFSRQSGVEKRVLDIGVTIQESLLLVRSSLPANMEIEVNIEENCKAIYGNATQLNQVLINLCTNAADAFSGLGGKIVVDLSNEASGNEHTSLQQEEASGGTVLLAVRDNGAGIEERYLKKIFDPYFTTKEIGKGTGIGLAVVHGIVKSHGGSISLETEPGRGTCFTIKFPAVEEIPEGNNDTGHSVATGHERILVLDDEPAIAALMARHLENMGYEAECFTDPLVALANMKNTSEKYDLIITDMSMPQMMGDIFSREALKVLPDVPVVICTGYSEDISEEQADLLGVRAILLKPVEKHKLSMTLRDILDRDKLLTR